jgi:hypothetical protein
MTGPDDQVAVHHLLHPGQFPDPANVITAPGGSGYVHAEHPVAKALNRARNLRGFAGAAGGRASASESLHNMSAIMHGGSASTASAPTGGNWNAI